MGFLLLFPLVALAGSGAVVPDLTPAEELLDRVLEEQDRQDEQAAFDASAELFPSVVEEESDVPADAFLTVRTGGKVIALRDVLLKEWFAPYVRDLAELQLVSGYADAAGVPTGLFGPGDSVTLEQVAKVAVLAAGIDTGACPLPPKNLSASGAWSASYVSCAEARGWSVYSDAGLDLRTPATREQVVVSVLQAFERDFSVDPATMTFTDVEKTSVYAPAIATASSDGVVSGYTDANGGLTGLFGPANTVNRAEFSKIVSIALRLYGE